MKILGLLFLATLLLVNPSQESPELQEAETLNQSAVKLYNEGKYNEALPLAKRALEIRDKLLPRSDPRISSSLTNLAEIYMAQKDYKPARQAFERLLQIQEELFGPEDVNIAFTLDRLAVLHYVARNPRETEAAYKRALALREKTLGPNDVQVAEAWFRLGEFYRFERDLKPAVESYKKALNLFGKLTGPTSSEFQRASDGFACLGYVHHNSELLDELRAIREQLFGPAASPEHVTVLNGRALSLPQPVYPGAAAARRLTGLVVVKVQVDETGSVIAATDMCKGPPFLSEAAVAAALKARFSPTILDGKPIMVSGVIQYNFTRRFR